jgi:hypothetical protein
MALSLVHLSQHKDKIKWRWTSNGQYSVAFAYECQFQGAITQPQIEIIWQTATEPKCKFFSWLTMHDRVLTTDNMLRKTALAIITAPCVYVCMNRLSIFLLNVIMQRQYGT